IDPVDMSEGTATDVMIDTDQELLVQPIQACALNTVTFQNDCRFKTTIHPIRMHNPVGKRQGPVNAGNGIMHDHFGFLAETAQNLSTGKSRADRIAVGTGVRGQDEALASLDVFEDF